VRRLLLVAALLGTVRGAGAQSDTGAMRVRLTLEEGVRIGRQAPEVRLPYATKDGNGPASQPFDLSKELGRVVVLAFFPGDFTPGCVAEWQALRDRAPTMFGPDVVVAGISTDSLASHVRFAQEFDLPFKFLSDTGLMVTRRYAFVDGPRSRRAVVVVGRDGRVKYVDAGFAALDPQSYVHLGAAIKAAREKP
jgi:thioredoxin-dependent peroxiredoxin